MRLDFKEERDADFLSSYKAVIKEYGWKATSLRRDTLLSKTVMRKAKRFYVSEEQAFRVVSNLLRGKRLVTKNRLKLEMYREILTRVNAELNSSSASLIDIVSKVINQESPRFYMTIKSAQILHYQLIKTNKL